MLLHTALALGLHRMKCDPGHHRVNIPGSEPSPVVAVSMEEVTDPSFPLLPVVKRSPQPLPPAQWSLAGP